MTLLFVSQAKQENAEMVQHVLEECFEMQQTMGALHMLEKRSHARVVEQVVCASDWAGTRGGVQLVLHERINEGGAEQIEQCTSAGRRRKSER